MQPGPFLWRILATRAQSVGQGPCPCRGEGMTFALRIGPDGSSGSSGSIKPRSPPRPLRRPRTHRGHRHRARRGCCPGTGDQAPGGGAIEGQVHDDERKEHFGRGRMEGSPEKVALRVPAEGRQDRTRLHEPRQHHHGQGEQQCRIQPPTAPTRRRDEGARTARCGRPQTAHPCPRQPQRHQRPWRRSPHRRWRPQQRRHCGNFPTIWPAAARRPRNRSAAPHGRTARRAPPGPATHGRSRRSASAATQRHIGRAPPRRQ